MQILQHFLAQTKRALPSLKRAAPASRNVVQPAAAAPAKPARQSLSIPCPDPVEEDRLRDFHTRAAQNLIRQEDWEAFSQRLKAADAALEKTPGGMPVSELLSFGARADVVQAAEHALFDGKPDPDAPLLQGIEAFEQVLADFPNDPMIAAVVAQTHMDIGWAWRGAGHAAETPRRNLQAFAAHFDRAREILEDHAIEMETSALLTTAHCALLGGTEVSTREVAERYDRLIQMDPTNMRAMRALGNYLLPRWFGSYDALELEARRMAVRTQAHLGAGGYTWVMLDAIATDDEACGRLDLAFFIDGLRDILLRTRDPHTVNLLAAYCANNVAQSSSGNDLADLNRAQIAKCADWIVRGHLTELHAMTWAHAARGFDNNLRIRSASRFADSGLADAMRTLEKIFRRELAAGQRVIFTEGGAVAEG
ncbi:MAG: hypothetical protein ACSHWZ_06135 [Sulfitobacter sp.]